jgi:hypothetical protein
MDFVLFKMNNESIKMIIRKQLLEAINIVNRRINIIQKTEQISRVIE